MRYKQIYEDILITSPVKIIECNKNAIKNSVSEKNLGGIFFPCDKNPTIVICRDCSYFNKIIYLVHEIGHAKCFVNKCSCYKTQDHIKREKHAHNYEIRELYDRQLWKILAYSLADQIYILIKGKDKNRQIAIQSITQTYLWEKAIGEVRDETIIYLQDWNIPVRIYSQYI